MRTSYKNEVKSARPPSSGPDTDPLTTNAADSTPPKIKKVINGNY